MSLNSRIKERREQLGMSRPELAKKIGVSDSAISNYENAISNPKIELLYKLFEALECDANYLYQDEMSALTYKTKPTPEEFEIIKKYRELDDHGREMVDIVLLKEYDRCTSFEDNILDLHSHMLADAAHSRTDIDIEEGTDITENNIMDEKDF